MKSYDYLISYNIKPSVQRIAIMDYLLAHKTHPSIDEIYLALCKDIPTLSKTTVYNTLKLFVEHVAALMLQLMKRMRVLTAILPYMLISFARNVVKYSIYPIVMK